MVITSSEAWTLSGHCEEYTGTVRASHQQLVQAWEELDISPDQQDDFLRQTAVNAEAVWEQAIHAAQTAIETAKEQTAEAERRTAKLKADLSDEHFGYSEAEERERPTSIQGRLRAAQDVLRVWSERRTARQQKYEALKGRCEQLRDQLGKAGSSVPIKTVTLYALDGLAMELKNLEEEQIERQKRLDLRLKELRKHCMNLGEDEGKIAAQVHASLGASRDAQSSTQDLSDKTFDGLRTTVLEFQDLERTRSDEAEVFLNTLQSLWEAMNVPEDDLDREVFTKLMTGHNRLHKASHERCTQEIGRLEGARKDLMLTIIEQKQQNIAAICQSSHMNVPELHVFDSQEPGEISDALARTLKQLGNVTSEAENRKPILDAIVGLQTTLTESEWLAAYEDDPNKYKGRDSTRKIQRAIAASEQRKQLPNLVADLKELLDCYRSEYNMTFVYDGQPYQTACLPALMAKIEAEEQKRLQGSKSKGQVPPLKVAKTPSVSTPRRGASSGLSARPATSTKKPIVPSLSGTPRGDRRKTDLYTSQTSSISRADSASSARSDVDAVSLTSRVSKLLTSNASSPAVSRTASNLSNLDAESIASHIPKLKTSKKQEKSSLKKKDEAPLVLSKMRQLNLEATENDDKASNLDAIPAVHGNHRRSISG